MGVTVREKVKGSGEYWLFIIHKNRRKAKKIGRDKKLAVEAAKKIRAKLVLGDMDLEEKTCPTFKDYAEIWLEGDIKNFKRKTTYVRYKRILKSKIYPALGHKLLCDIKKSDVKNLFID